MNSRRLLSFILALSLIGPWAGNSWASDGASILAARAPRKTAPAPVPAPVLLPPPPLFAADYTVKADGFKVGEMNRAVQALGNDTYLVETHLKTTGIVSLFKPDEFVERSVLKVTPTTYMPLEYSSRYTGRSKDVVESLRFDWNQMVVHSLRDGALTDVKIEPGVLDKLMYQVQLQYDLSHGVNRFHYRVADRGKIEDYEMEVVGTETIDTAVGKQRTVKVKKGTTLIWCAIDLDYVPVKLEQSDDGHTIATYIVSFRRNPSPAAAPPA